MDPSPPPCNIIFTHSEVTKVLKSLEDKTSLGLHVLSNVSIKLVNFSHPPLLPTLFNNCLALSYFPKAWRYGREIMIPNLT